MLNQHFKKPFYLAWIRTLSCLICGDNISSQACHIRFADPRYGKRAEAGMGRKSSDRWVVPMCHTHHEEQHRHGNERNWWAKKGVDPCLVALALYAAWREEDFELGEVILRANRGGNHVRSD